MKKIQQTRTNRPSRREFLRALALAAASAPAACATEAGPLHEVEPVCAAVGQGAKITHGPLSGGATDSKIEFSARLDKAGKVQFSLQPAAGGAPILTFCTIAVAENDFSVHLTATGLAIGTKYVATPLIDDAADATHAIETTTFPAAGAVAAHTFCFGSCQRHGDGAKGESLGKTFEVAANWPERPLFFAQIGDWTYPDYLFAKMGHDKDGNNYTVFPEEIRKSYLRRMDPTYPMRKLVSKMPLAHVWDDHDFAENNAHRDVTGKQSDRVSAFARYLPTYPLPTSQLGVWQQFSVGHVDYWLVDMRSQRTDFAKAIVPGKDKDGKDILKLVEPVGHTMLGSEQLDWLVAGLKASKALWKIVFFPVEINPRYDIVLEQGLALQSQIFAQAAGDGWCGYPTERKKILDLYTSGAVKNLIFLTGDAHQSSMKERDATCPPVFMAANLDIDQAPIMDLLAAIDIVPESIWPYWTQGGTGLNTIGRVRIVSSPKHQVICEAWDQNGSLLKTMTIQSEI